MTLIERLNAERDEKIAHASAIEAKARAESRELGPEEAEEIDKDLDDASGIEDQIKEAIAAQRSSQVRSERLDAARKASTQSRGRSGSGSASAVEVGKTLAEDDPKKGFSNPRQFLTVVMGQQPGSIVRDERLRMLATAGSDEQGGYSDAYGGFLVPEAFSPQLLSVPSEADPTIGRTTSVPMASPKVSIPARVDKDHSSSVSGGLTVGRSAETVSKSASRMQTEQVKLNATSLFGLAYATEEILVDSAISFVALLANGFGDEFNATILDEKINGTGVGQYEGVLVSPAKIEVSKETGQAADTIDYLNVLKMRARCWRYADAIWLANHDCLPQLCQLSLTVGVGGNVVWMPSAQEDKPDMLLGRPIFFTEFAKTVGDAGDIILCNWSQYLEGTYQPLQSAESMHVRFLNHERAFKFWMRNDGGSWWRSALTPRAGSTLSPIVTLAARE